MSRWWAVLWIQGGRRRGGILFFGQTSANSLQKPTTLSANSHKSFHQNFHQTFSNFHQTFSKGPKKGVKKWTSFSFSFSNFPPTLRNSSGTKVSHTFAPSVETNEAR